MATPTLGSVTLYGCESIVIEETGNIIPLAMPTEDSSMTEIFDMLGVVRMISITGTFTNSQPTGSPTTADSKATALLNLISGNQTPINFVDHNSNSITVMVMSVNINWDIPGYNCIYNIKLVRGIQI